MKGTPPYNKMEDSRPPLLFSKCCFVPLRIACLIIGYCTLVYNINDAAGFSVLFISFGIATHGFDHVDQPPEGSNPAENIQNFFIKNYVILFSYYFLLPVVWIILTIACLVGIHKRRPNLIRWYVIFMTLRFLLFFANTMYFTLDLVGLELLIPIFWICAAVYYVTIFHVYSEQLKRELEDGKETTNQLYAQNITIGNKANLNIPNTKTQIV